ncbi:head completion/stabilization protein [Pragia fontium]|uniref:Phage head completion protein (GPL) n=1 Tax=Pragia fontium DSM 5563 = ATCC 49100 TaxID=1122977 RepID=A0AAJ4W9G8_9GAMM|nr:head completion/stabilization protein [Pragia fontium]SFC49539.1 Phage head completion protein (GPL) [Pragia fontium DSM 5563 = ATCC 49100]
MFKANDREYSESIITNDGFWPDIDVADFEVFRTIPGDINHSQIAAALVDSVVEINRQLQDIAAQRRAQGYNTAATVPGVSVDGKNELITQYQKAVFARAKADLIGEYASLGRSEGHTGQDNPKTKADLLAEAAYTVRNIKGLKRVGVSLL